MKVLFVSHYSNLYGANIALLNLIKYLKNNYRIDPFVLITSKGPFTDKLDEIGVKYYIFKWYYWVHKKGTNFIIWTVKSFLNLIIYRLIFRELKKENKIFDIVHSNSSVINIGAFIAKKFNSKHIWHIRELGGEDFNLYYNRGNKNAGKYYNKYSSKVIAVSNAVRNKYINYIDKNKVEVVYDGVAEKLNNIDFTKLYNKEIINFSFVGIITKNKNQIEALRAAKILINKYGIKNFKIYFTGGYSDVYYKELDNFIKKNNLEENTFFTGYIDKLSNYRKKMDVALVCSKKEAFGLVTVEAMISNMPVIGANTGGTRELIDDDKTGYLYNLGDPEELALKMKKLILNRGLIEKFGENGCVKARKYFTVSINAENVYKIYKAII